MKQCPRCYSPHAKPGIFCSRSCANSRGPRTNEFKQIVRHKLSGKLKSNNLSDKNTYFRELDRFIKTADGPFSFIVLNVCYITNKPFYSQYRRKYSSEAIIANLKLYRSACRFKLNKKDHPELFDSNLINTFGWYCPSNKPNTNLTGVSWDHLFRIEDGFKLAIPPEILRHPANAELVPWQVNKRRNVSTITIEELYSRISLWSNGDKNLPKFYKF